MMRAGIRFGWVGFWFLASTAWGAEKFPGSGPQVDGQCRLFHEEINEHSRRNPSVQLEVPRSFQVLLRSWHQSIAEIEIAGSAAEKPLLRQLRQMLKRSRRERLSLDQSRVLCESVISGIANLHLVFSDASLIAQVYHDFCAPDATALKRLVVSSLEVVKTGNSHPESSLGSGTRHSAQTQALRFISYAVSLKLISAADWRLLLQQDSAFFLPLARTLSGQWERIGWDRHQRVEMARFLLQRRWTLRSLQETFQLSAPELISLEADMNPVQWLSYRHMQQNFSADFLVQLRSRSDSYQPPPGARVEGLEAEQPLLELLMDENVAFDYFLRVYAILRHRWQDWGFSSRTALESTVLSRFQAQRLTPGVRARLEQFVGADRLNPERVWKRARKTARQVARRLRPQATFASASQFIEFFSLPRHYQLSQQTDPTTIHSNELIQIQTVAEVYFAELYRQLPGFFALEPNVAEIQWLLQTPLQFPVLLDQDRPRSSEAGWQRPWRRYLRIRRFDDLQTARYVSDLLTEAVRMAVARAQSLQEWIDIAATLDRPDSLYPDLHRWMMSTYWDQAASLGDAQLNWLDRPFFARQKALLCSDADSGCSWLLQLSALRNSVEREKRSDLTLTDQAISWILSGGPMEAKDRLSAGEWERTLQQRRKILFRYLAARFVTGQFLQIDSAQYAAFQNHAVRHGFYLTQTYDLAQGKRVFGLIPQKQKGS